MGALIKNYASGRIEKALSDMTEGEVLSYRSVARGYEGWPAHVTFSQMRRQIAWEQCTQFRRFSL